MVGTVLAKGSTQVQREREVDTVLGQLFATCTCIRVIGLKLTSCVSFLMKYILQAGVSKGKKEFCRDLSSLSISTYAWVTQRVEHNAVVSCCTFDMLTMGSFNFLALGVALLCQCLRGPIHCSKLSLVVQSVCVLHQAICAWMC